MKKRIKLGRMTINRNVLKTMTILVTLDTSWNNTAWNDTQQNDTQGNDTQQNDFQQNDT
jgi:hypothetical protein